MNSKSRFTSVRLWAVLAAFLGYTLGSQGATATNTSATNIARKVQIVAKQGRALRGMTAKSKVTISGMVTTDSYDSSDPAKSTGGLYDPAKAGEEGFVGTASKTANDMEIAGDANIIGPIAVGAPGVLKPLGSDATVGSSSFVSAGNNGRIEDGWYRDDLNVSFPDVIIPSGSMLWPPPLPGLLGTTNYAYLMSNGSFKITHFVLNSSQKAIVTGRATLYVENTLDISGAAQLIIAPGASLNLYVGVAAAFSGGGLVNQTGSAANFNYYGLKNNVQVYISGASAFVGIIYAPYAKLDLTGASSFNGASVSNEIVLGGTFAFHFDQAIRSAGLRYIPVTWKEL